jgi:murein DD-endopeptidase MepM/ murein hydrolase activator NlpD
VRNLLAITGRAFGLAAVLLLPVGTATAAANGWQAPLRPVAVVRNFQPPPTPYAAGHRGVDLGGEPGQPVLAAAAGVISYAAPLAGRGVVVVVHGNLRTTYEPVQATVRRGDRVSAGGQIGLLQAGHPGCPVTACLHWGLLRGETYLDPLSMLGKRQVRLLPLGGEAPALPAAEQVRATTVSSVGTAGPAVNPRLTWSVAAIAGAGVLMVRRRR